MKASKFVCLSLLIALPATANPFFFNIEGGKGNGELNADYSPANSKIQRDALAVYFTQGLFLGSNFFVAASEGTTRSDSFFGADDRYEIQEFKLMGGYNFDVSDHFRIRPMLGISRWELKTKTGALSGSKPRGTKTYDGDNPFAKISIELPISELTAISISFTDTHYKFGSEKLTQAGVTFTFN